MSTRKRVKKANQNLHKQIWKLSLAAIKRLKKWFLRSLLVMGRRVRLSKSGFVLPTVAMVLLVVTLLTIAILFRSFDRSKNANNVRVSQEVLSAATPALDRARAKIDALFSGNDPLVPRATPSDKALYDALNSDKYIFGKDITGGETRVKIVYDINGSGTIQGYTNTAPIEDSETLTNAWKFPVDTDNNGKFDSYTLYGIYFRSPSRNADGKFIRARNPLEARTAPMNGGTTGGQCANATNTSASLIGDSDWYKSGAKLTKSFFVYTANVPITNLGSLDTNKYEKYKSNKGFSALEFQQDRVLLPLNNNAAWYEDDIEVGNATTVRLNGRVVTNSNLMVAGNGSSNKMIFYQVSDPDSCYYDQENSKIIVGGNVANGDIRYPTDEGDVEVHRFQGKGTTPTGQNNTNDGISGTNKTTTQTGGRWVGYNNGAYSQRIGLMVEAALSLHGTGDPTVSSVSGVTKYPQEVKDRFKQRFDNSNETKEPRKILTEELQNYFKDHTRRVPYAEVPSSTGSVTSLGSYTVANVLGSTNPIQPPNEWMAIEAPTSGNTAGYTSLPLNFGSNTMYLQATEPKQQEKDGKEYFLGDRIVVGNNLPFSWPKYTTTGTFDKFAEHAEPQPVKNGSNTVYWNNSSNGNATSIQRTRQSQLQNLPDLGSVERDGFWETEAAKKPASYENTGGLRVITGAGIYIDGVATAAGGTGVRVTNSFLPATSLNAGVTEPAQFTTNTVTATNNIIVWPDLMPMWDGSKKGDLQMRATAVYHYKQGLASTTLSSQVDPNQVPIACVSSYYDPTNSTTARNLNGLADVSGISDTNGDGTFSNSDKLADGSTPSPSVGSNNGRSNNGVTYGIPYADDTGRTTAVSSYRDKLNRQARMIFPTGRLVNESLRKALSNIDASKPRSLADNAAIDSAICALKILDGTLSVQTSPKVTHGAIKEAAFLDGRQIKALNNDINADNTLDNTKIAETKTNLSNVYTLPLEQRQPLEIRVTELDLNLLKNKEIGTATNSSSNDQANDQEYLLPNSGIIYATREDALPDLSDNSADLTTQALVSPTDFELDSTRRPNGIRLINGTNLARKNFYRVAEKGLILATNLPIYIKDDFNLHKDPDSSTVREEFEATVDEASWSNFYTRANNPNHNFACRQNQPGCNGSGDQWRPATIISDAQTLLSGNFWDGFRNQGDYELNNNQGNSAASPRLKQGFWNNNFVTSANWAGSDSYPSSKNSYLTNGVTPIQRRVNNFPEYIMEVCRIIPTSECKSTDWVVGYNLNGDTDLDDPVNFDVNGDGVVNSDDTEKIIKANQLGKALGSAVQTLNTVRLGAGTTARPALVAADQRYARRVAFARSQFNTLAFTQIGTGTSAKNAAKPLGVGCSLDTTATTPENNGCQYPNNSTRTAGIHYGNTANNALWFRTTNNTTGEPATSADITYANNRPLYYLPPNQGGTKLVLPETPDIGGLSLNLPTGDQSASDYAVCIKNGGISQSYISNSSNLTTSPGNGNCPTATYDAISNFLGTGSSTGLYDLTSPNPSGSFSVSGNNISGGTLTAQQTLNVYNLPKNSFANGATITLDSGGKPDAIFVLKADSSLKFGENCSAANDTCGDGIVLKPINGVNPNNIFWAINGAPQFENVNSAKPHQLAGNFIGKSSAPKIGNNTKILGRLLGFTNTPSIIGNATITAISSTDQPSLVPILQIHSPTGTPGGTTFNGSLQDNWLQVADTTTANAAFITGDSPSRPAPSEGGGGLHNFLRFLENWDDETARISGSFIQYKRSSYGSAPFNPVDPTVTDPSASLFYTLNSSNSQPPYYNQTGFRYRGGASASRASFYTAPTRAFGFDVAILSQSPDLFAQRFTVKPTTPPSEYFREVSRDDLWIQSLLCAAQKTGSSYSYAIDDSERPSTCSSISSYND